MKISPKEKLNDKAKKMIDLLFDEVAIGGTKDISTSFTSKNGFKYFLTIGMTVVDPKQASDEDEGDEGL